jgi:hypothetical protein
MIANTNDSADGKNGRARAPMKGTNPIVNDLHKAGQVVGAERPLAICQRPSQL